VKGEETLFSLIDGQSRTTLLRLSQKFGKGRSQTINRCCRIKSMH
jgi:hypothetical protein